MEDQAPQAHTTTGPGCFDQKVKKYIAERNQKQGSRNSEVQSEDLLTRAIQTCEQQRVYEWRIAGAKPKERVQEHPYLELEREESSFQEPMSEANWDL